MLLVPRTVLKHLRRRRTNGTGVLPIIFLLYKERRIYHGKKEDFFSRYFWHPPWFFSICLGGRQRPNKFRGNENWA